MMLQIEALVCSILKILALFLQRNRVFNYALIEADQLTIDTFFCLYFKFSIFLKLY